MAQTNTKTQEKLFQKSCKTILLLLPFTQVAKIVLPVSMSRNGKLDELLRKKFQKFIVNHYGNFMLGSWCNTDLC